MDVVEPRKIFIHTMGSINTIEICQSDVRIKRDPTYEKWCSYNKKSTTMREKLYSGTRMRKVPKMMENISKEQGMSKEEWQ